MEVVEIVPHGFCGGVAGAIAKAIETSRSGKVYCLHELVHNELVISDLEKRGVVFVERVDDIPEGATALFSAHGVSPQTRRDAAARSLRIVDTTCPFVARVHRSAKEFSERGLAVVVIGNKDHAEVAGIRGEIKGGGWIYPETPEGVDRIGVVSQTTMNADDVAAAVAELGKKYAVETSAEVCSATKERQDAVRRFKGDAVLVLGSANSSNTRRLCEVASCRAFRAGTMEEVEAVDFSGVGRLGVTSGASTPESLFEKAVSYLRNLSLAAAVLFAASPLSPASAETQTIDGVVYECRDGMCMPVSPGALDGDASAGESAASVRKAAGYMDAEEFCRFLDGEDPSGRFSFSGRSPWLVLVLLLLGGFAMNLTPCTLPMVPVTAIVIGRSPKKGFLYSLGIIAAYGVLGVLAVRGASSFGEIQSSGWFSLAAGCVFLALALAGAGLFRIDFSRWRPDLKKMRLGAALPFALGVASAAAAGSCVAPVLVAMLVFAADLAAEGSSMAYAAPFAFAAGMALPWPFLAAGMKVLPLPGAWMKKVNFAMALVVAALAVWHFARAFDAFSGKGGSAGAGRSAAWTAATPENFESIVAAAAKPVFVDLSAPWCKSCAAMEKKTFRDEAVLAKLSKFTLVRLDASDLKKVRRIPAFLDIKGLPAFAVFGQ